MCLYNAVTICSITIITLQHAAALYHGEGEVCGRGGGLQFNIHVLFYFLLFLQEFSLTSYKFHIPATFFLKLY